MDCGMAARATNLPNNLGFLLMGEEKADEIIVHSIGISQRGDGKD